MIVVKILLFFTFIFGLLTLFGIVMDKFKEKNNGKENK